MKILSTLFICSLLYFTAISQPLSFTADYSLGLPQQRMAQNIRAQIFTTCAPAHSSETNLYNLRIMDRKRDALLSACRALFVPTVPDWQALTLPPPLHSLYYAFRPLRLSKVYSSALLQRVGRNV